MSRLAYKMLSSSALSLALVGAPCTTPTDAQRPRDEPTSARVATVMARAAIGISALEVPAQVIVAPQASGAVSPTFTARVTKISTRVGERVDRGAPLVDVVMPQLVAAAGAHAASRIRVDALTRRKAQLDILKAEGLARSSELSDVDIRLAEAKADQQTANAVLKSAGVSADAAAAMLENGGTLSLRSPIAGLVTEVNGSVGAIHEPSATPLVRIQGDQSPRIEAKLRDRLDGRAQASFVIGSQSPIPIKLIAQSPIVDPRDGTTSAWFEPVATTAIAGGTRGKIVLAFSESSGAVIVPASAIGGDGLLRWVTARVAGAERRVPVELIMITGADAIVRGELRVGDALALTASP